MNLVMFIIKWKCAEDALKYFFALDHDNFSREVDKI